jgi:polyketide synthase PksN
VPKSVHNNWAIKELHPMIDENKSTMKGQSFSKLFRGDEFYLKDHVVGDQNVLPGVAYLEMARAAGEISSEAEIKEIRNVIWAKPIVLGKENVEAKVNLVSKESNVLGYEVTTSEGKHSQGEVIFGKGLPGILEKINIEGLISKCNQSVGPEEIYKGFLEIGLNYGTTFQSIIELRANTEIAIAKLKLSDEIKETINQFGLHPSLMDGALQSVVGLVFTQKRSVNDLEKILMLPFGLKSLKIFKPFPEECYAIVKVSAESLQSTDRAVKKFDITVTDMRGEVIVEFKGFSVREMRADILKSLGKTKETTSHTKVVLAKIEDEMGTEGLMYFEPYWEKRSLESDVSSIYRDCLSEEKDQIGIIDSVQEMDSIISKLKSGNTYRGIVWKLNSQSLEKDIENKALGIFRLTKALIESKPKDKVWLINVHHGAAIDESLAGFAKTLRLENPKYEYRNLDVPIDTTETELNQILNNEIGHIYSEIEKKEKGSIEIRYVKEKDVLKRAVKLIREQQVLGNETLKNYSFKEDGLYLITGGAGGLGLIFAKYLSEKYKGNIVLLGRSELSDEKTKKLEALNRLGGKVIYVTADISKYDEIVTAVQKGKEQLNLVSKEKKFEAILHCAGVIQDAFIIKKTEDQFREVITPKIIGTNNIQKLSELEQPKLVILFSSIASVLGNLGQCDYALGNAYMDAVANAQAQNQTTKYVSINWPLWREGENVFIVMRSGSGCYKSTDDEKTWWEMSTLRRP